MNISQAPGEGWVWHKSGVGHLVVVGLHFYPQTLLSLAGLKITTVIAAKSKLTHLSAALHPHPPPPQGSDLRNALP